MIMFVKKFIKNKITLGSWDNKLIEIFTDLKRFELTEAYQKLQCELNELHEIELYDRLDKIKNLQNQINFKLDSHIEKSKFRSFLTKILVIGSVLKLKINTIILKIFYAVESDMVLRTTTNRVAKKNTQTVTADTILVNLDKGFDS